MQVSTIEYHFEGVQPFKICYSFLQDKLIHLVENEGMMLGEIGIIFCSDQYLLQMNKKYLNHDYFTDIITFNYNEKKYVQGDLFISVDRIRENAVSFGVSIREELFRVIFHGLLHLTGYDDKTKKEKELMRGKENYYLSFIDFNLDNHGVEI